MLLFSCPLCGESVEVPEIVFDEETHPLTCPVCGSFVQDEELTIPIPDWDENLRRRKVKR